MENLFALSKVPRAQAEHIIVSCSILPRPLGMIRSLYMLTFVRDNRSVSKKLRMIILLRVHTRKERKM